MASEATIPITKYWKLYEFTGFILGKMSKWIEIDEEWWKEYEALYEGAAVLDDST